MKLPNLLLVCLLVEVHDQVRVVGFGGDQIPQILDVLGVELDGTVSLCALVA